MRTIWFLASSTLLAIPGPCSAQKINPNNQINWPASAASGAPSASCTAANYGQPYTDFVSNVSYTCGSSGWFTNGGGGGSGVTRLIAGPFITLSPSGGTGTVTVGSTAITPGLLNYATYYASSASVTTDDALYFTTPTNNLTDQLVWAGGGGINFGNNSRGGSLNLNATDAIENSAQNQITIGTVLPNLNHGTNPGQVSLTTSDSGVLGTSGNSNAANILISANETTGATIDNSGNVTVSASASYPSPGSGTTNSGNVNISSSNLNGLGGNIALSAASPNGGGGNVTLTAEPNGGFITLNASKLLSNAPNLTIDASGNLTSPGFIQGLNLYATSLTTGNCVQAGTSGQLVSASGPCGSGGGGGISGLTAGYLPLAGSATTLTANSHLDEVTNAGLDTFTQGVVITDGSGNGGADTATEGTAPSAASGVDVLWADSTSHRWKQNPNNAGATIVPGVATAGTSGHCVQFASNGVDLVDAGATCSGGSGGGTPSFTADSGAGTGSTITIVSGSTDFHGYVNVTIGTSPAASAGVVTIKFGNTYSVVPKCSVAPANTAAAILSGNAQVFVAEGTATTALFVMNVGSTALTASSTYDWVWTCGQ